MDFSPVIAQVLGTLGWFIPLMMLTGLLKSPWAKGHIGAFLERLFACSTAVISQILHGFRPAWAWLPAPR